jgi:hypothetical protein
MVSDQPPAIRVVCVSVSTRNVSVVSFSFRRIPPSISSAACVRPPGVSNRHRPRRGIHDRPASLPDDPEIVIPGALRRKWQLCAMPALVCPSMLRRQAFDVRACGSSRGQQKARAAHSFPLRTTCSESSLVGLSTTHHHLTFHMSRVRAPTAGTTHDLTTAPLLRRCHLPSRS